MAGVAEKPRGHRSAEATVAGLLEADLGFHGSDARHATHAWHPFPAKFPPQLPEFFIRELTEPGDTVLDPMLGSGTTLVEARRLGRRAVGCDIDPLARLLAEAKLTALPRLPALESGREVLRDARRHHARRPDELERSLADRFSDRTRSFVDYWFVPERQMELLALILRIEAVEDPELQRFLQVVFSSTIIAKSGGVSMARDLAHTRPHRVMTKKTRSAFAEFDRKLAANVGGLEHGYDLPAATVLARSAAATLLPAESVDLIVTSPPYANNAIDYMRAHKFSLVWLGFDVPDLTSLRKQYLGHDARANGPLPDLPPSCEETLAELGLADPRKAAALRRYLAEMTGVLAETKRVLRPGKAALIVVASSRLRGIDVRTHENLAAIGESLGLSLAGIGVRQLDRDRRMMPARWSKTAGSQIEQRMHDEHVIGLVKG